MNILLIVLLTIICWIVMYKSLKKKDFSSILSVSGTSLIALVSGLSINKYISASQAFAFIAVIIVSVFVISFSYSKTCNKK